MRTFVIVTYKSALANISREVVRSTTDTRFWIKFSFLFLSSRISWSYSSFYRNYTLLFTYSIFSHIKVRTKLSVVCHGQKSNIYQRIIILTGHIGFFSVYYYLCVNYFPPCMKPNLLLFNNVIPIIYRIYYGQK